MDSLDRYLIAHSTPQGEALAWLEKQTHIRTRHPRMLSGPVEGRFLSMVVKMTGARRVLELGTFTGYSAICLASAMDDGGVVDTLELNDEMEGLIREGFSRAGVSERINLVIGDCRDSLKSLAGEGALYDLVFIDANKREYPEYYDLVFDLVRPGGWILADNTLFYGKVCEDPVPEDEQTQGIVAFNEKVSADPRVELVLLPLRDGITLIHKLAQSRL